MKEEKVKHGKPWNVAAIFDSYSEADNYRIEKLLVWEDNKKEGMQIKVKRRRSDERFAVKTRLHPDFEPKLKKEKKHGKRKNQKSRKRDSNKGKIQVDETSI